MTPPARSVAKMRGDEVADFDLACRRANRAWAGLHAIHPIEPTPRPTGSPNSSSSTGFSSFAPLITPGNSSDSAQIAASARFGEDRPDIPRSRTPTVRPQNSANCPTCRTFPARTARNRLGANNLPAGRCHLLERRARPGSMNDHAHHVAAVVGFAHDHIGVMSFIGGCRDLAPCLRAGFHRAIFEQVCVSIRPERGDHDPDCVVVRVVRIARSGRVDRHDHARSREPCRR